MVKLTRLAFVPAAFALLSSAQPVAAGIAINGQVVSPVTNSSAAGNPPVGTTAVTSNDTQAAGNQVLSGVATQAAATLPDAPK